MVVMEVKVTAAAHICHGKVLFHKEDWPFSSMP